MLDLLSYTQENSIQMKSGKIDTNPKFIDFQALFDIITSVFTPIKWQMN